MSIFYFVLSRVCPFPSPYFDGNPFAVCVLGRLCVLRALVLKMVAPLLLLGVGKERETLSRVLVARLHRLLGEGQHRVSVDLLVFLCSVFRLVLFFFTPLYFCFRSFGSVFPGIIRG